MSMLAIKRLAVVLLAFCGILFVSSVFSFWSYVHLHLQAAFADDQTQIFDEMRTQALQSTTPSDIARSLEYAVNYYPSGTKQEAGSDLDRVVERHRTAVIATSSNIFAARPVRISARVRSLGFRGSKSLVVHEQMGSCHLPDEA